MKVILEDIYFGYNALKILEYYDRLPAERTRHINKNHLTLIEVVVAVVAFFLAVLENDDDDE